MKKRSKFIPFAALILAGAACIQIARGGDATRIVTETVKATAEASKDHSTPHVRLHRVVVRNSGDSKKPVAWLGVHIGAVSPLAAAQLGLAEGMGLAVEHIVPDSPAEKAGLLNHDILTKFEDQSLINAEQFQVLVKSKQPGDSVALTAIRRGREQTVTATLGEANLETVHFDAEKLLPNTRVYSLLKDKTAELDNIIINRDSNNADKHFHTSVVNLLNRNVTMSDYSGTYELKTEDGKKLFKASRKGGEVIWNGIIETDADRSEVPKALREKLESLEKLLSNDTAHADITLENPYLDGEHVEIRIIKKEKN